MRSLGSRRHHLENKSESEENAGTPPRCLGENRSCLSHSDECVGGRAGAAEVGGQSASLAGLQQDRCNQDEGVENEDD